MSDYVPWEITDQELCVSKPEAAGFQNAYAASLKPLSGSGGHELLGR